MDARRSVIPALVAVLVACGGEDVKNPLVGMLGKDIGNSEIVTPATPINQQRELLRCYMSEPADVQLTMSVTPLARPAASVFAQPPVTGWFVLQWGSGDGTQHTAWIDLVNGVSIPLHAQNVKVAFVLNAAVPATFSASLNASVSVGTTTQNNATFTYSRTLVTDGTTFFFPAPPFAADVTVFAVGDPVGNVVPASCLLEFLDSTPLLLDLVPLTLGGAVLPVTIPLPGNCGRVDLKNTDGAGKAGRFTLTFGLAF